MMQYFNILDEKQSSTTDPELRGIIRDRKTQREKCGCVYFEEYFHLFVRSGPVWSTSPDASL